MQRVDDCLAKAAGKRYFSKLDARSGFYQIPIATEDQPKTAFWWQGIPWMYTRAPFGLTNIPAHFQEAMDTILATEGLEAFVTCYVHDILVFSDTADGIEPVPLVSIPNQIRFFVEIQISLLVVGTISAELEGEIKRVVVCKYLKGRTFKVTSPYFESKNASQ
jgi:hypothetical protein